MFTNMMAWFKTHVWTHVLAAAAGAAAVYYDVVHWVAGLFH